MEDKKIIEINGVKLEIDLRQAKIVENFKVGDNVKILTKKYSTWESSAGVIVGFDNFKERPTIIVAYLKVDYSGSEIEFVYLNKDTVDVEMVMTSDLDIPFEKNRVVDDFNKVIESAKEKVRELERKKDYFLKYFNQYFK